jgi:hypothetical protein
VRAKRHFSRKRAPCPATLDILAQRDVLRAMAEASLN